MHIMDVASVLMMFLSLFFSMIETLKMRLFSSLACLILIILLSPRESHCGLQRNPAIDKLDEDILDLRGEILKIRKEIRQDRKDRARVDLQLNQTIVHCCEKCENNEKVRNDKKKTDNVPLYFIKALQNGLQQEKRMRIKLMYEIASLKDANKNLNKKLQEMKENQTITKTDLATLKIETQYLTSAQKHLKEEGSKLKELISKYQQDSQHLNVSFHGLQGEVKAEKGNMMKILSTIELIKQESTNVSSIMAEIKREYRSVMNSITGFEIRKGDYHNMTETVLEVVKELNETKERLPDVGVRLVQGRSQSDGRVELFSLGQWGTVCDDGWDNADANVVCHMMGLSGPGRAIGNAFYGEGKGPIWMRNVHCRGNETTLMGCPHQILGSTGCSHSEDAGVFCGQLPDVDVRLVQGRSQSDGRVEFFFLGQWGTVCNNGWDNADANVVCNMMGLSGPGHAIGNAFYGEGKGPIWMRNVHCRGNESTLMDCTYELLGSTCRHSEDAGVICGQLPDVDVRLVQGRSESDGRVELFFLGQWGTVCDDGWDNKDANVVCSMLGLSGPGHSIGNAAYGEGKGTIWMRNVNCRGNETTLMDCPHQVLGSTGCSHSEDAGVICGQVPDVDVRLVQGRYQSDGRVEIYFFGLWGTVCDGGWDNKDANVVCRMLGLSGPGHAIGKAAYGEGKGPIWMRYVNCRGNETTLMDCPHQRLGSFVCPHSDDAGVICGQVPDIDVRLVQGRSQSDGRVELFFLGQWGTVCDNGWGKEDANVVCHMMGLSGPGHAVGNAAYGEGKGPIWMNFVNCRGNESTLMDCPHQVFGNTGCNHSEDAGVICGQLPDVDVRLVQGRSQSDGRVEIFFLGQWGTVCDDGWDKADANVVCSMLGLSGPGHAIGNASYGEGKGPIWMRYVNCRGNERTLMDCPHQLLGSFVCPHSDDAGVICGQVPDIDVRLVQGRSQSDGRVELFFLGQWGTVCDNGWGKEDANVVCHMMGLSGPGHAVGNAAYGEGKGPIWMNFANCRGNESTLMDCPHQVFGNTGCNHSEDAGVICGQLPDVDVRLVQGRSQSDGRVELFFLGQWGTVCGFEWDNEDANVVCRMLGLSGPGHAIGNAAHGEGKGPIWMSFVDCRGNETTLMDCPHLQSGTTACRHSDDAGVICGQVPDVEIRLVKGRSQSDGRVELFLLGQWGTVCDNRWGNEDANVVCHMMGLSGPGHAVGNAAHGEGKGPIWMRNVNCRGNESSLMDCAHEVLGSTGCSHSEDAGVICGQLPDVDVRLVQGRSQSDGRVEIFFLGQWGTVCDDGWDNEDANVVCRMLGLSGPGHAIGNAAHGEGKGPIWMKYLNCRGNESTLMDCPHQLLGSFLCPHSDDAGVICGQLPDVDVRLVQGRSQSDGRVEIFFLGQWGTVCDDGWDNEDANVVCRILGLSGPGHAIGNAAHGEGKGPIWMSYVNCRGNETTLMDCPHQLLGSFVCPHNDDAGVICGQVPDIDVRLVQGRSQSDGRVELFFLGQWGTVCDNGWGNEDANVVCHMMGLSGPGHAVGNAAYGVGKGPIWMSFANCRGNESTLMDCTHQVFGNTGCNHSEDAGVICGQVPDVDVRLVQGRSQSDGRVELFFLGQWGTVCGFKWDNEDANVVCRMLGLSGPGHAIGKAAHGEGKGPIWMSFVDCRGNETTLMDCPHLQSGTTACRHSDDAGVICGQVPDVEIRLVKGRSQSDGRVELFLLGQWGTVCDNGWGNEDANVVCHMMGLSGPGHAVGNAAHGEGKGPVWMSMVNCRGNESSLMDCPHQVWVFTGCSHSEDAGVICGKLPDVDVRLVQGRSQSDGRVEIFFLGQWGTVCDDGWDNEDANVVCRMLGLSGPGHAIGNAAHGEGKGPIWMKYLNCRGNESTLMDCPHQLLGSFLCPHSDDAGVICGQLPDFDVRLVQGRSQSDGRVEIFFLGQWGTVCDDGWDNEDANVVCRILGLSGPGHAIGNAAHGEGKGPIWMSYVNCRGNETTLMDCPHQLLGSFVCPHNDDAGVICGQVPDIDVRLVQGRSQSDGRVELFFLGQWGTVCDNGWGNEDANVVCHMMGLSGPGHAVGNAAYGVGKGPIWMSFANCRGNESTLMDCPHQVFGNTGCNHSEDAGVICGQVPDVDVRLVQGRSQSDGRVELFFLGQWGTVCGFKWDNEDANVVCRMLGLSGPGHAIGNAAHGEGKGPIWMSFVDCRGNETTLMDCPHLQSGTTACRHSDDAGVICGQVPDVEIRLVKGRSQSDGRVELFLLGQWGTVCDNRWGNEDANVVCHMMGLSGPGHAVGNAAHGEGKGPIWMRNVNCRGNESSLMDCAHEVLGSTGCSHSEDAGVICGQLPDVDVRLVQGRSQSDGRVELFFLGQWGTVCDGGWDNKDANVVCRMLGLSGPGHAIGNAAHGEGKGPIWMNYVNCRGNESTLMDCPHQLLGSFLCPHSDDAGVICGQVPDVDVRLVQGRSQSDGRVEIFFLGQWGTVCDGGWDKADANVVCRMLGLSGPGHAIGKAAYGEGKGPIWMRYVNCRGNETTLMDCPHQLLGSFVCPHSDDAGVICGQVPDINVRLVQGRSQSDGRVELFFLGQWGTVCDNGWGKEDANVVCHMMGLSGPGHAVGNAAYGEGKGPIWMNFASCRGNESTLMDCPHQVFGNTGCNHSEDAGVICGQLPDVDVRLVQGRSQSDGRVELFFLGQWGTVCGFEWDNEDANVVCRMLGLSGPGHAIGKAAHGEGKGPIWMSFVDCRGNETTLMDCPHLQSGTTACRHSDDAGVICGQVPDVDVRLVQGRSQSEGRVELFFLGQWGTVCDDGWDTKDANVVCRMLGLSGPGRAIGNAVYGAGAGPIWMTNVDCKGHEKTLVDCLHGGLGPSSCDHGEDAGVICGQLAGLPAERGNL